MPRGPRLDIADGLYHVIARGVERRAIFCTDGDRRDFLRRLAKLQGVQDITLFAFALMDNHFHLVLRRGRFAVGSFMARLLTGYAVTFNRRHERVGHLFQNRYKAIVCDDEAYLLDLVRYVHLNPVRAGIVQDPRDYPWTSHAAYLHPRRLPWLDPGAVLELHGGRRQYEAFMAAGIGQGRRSDLNGMRPGVDGNAHSSLGGQILGSESFTRRVVATLSNRTPASDPQAEAADILAALAIDVASRLAVLVAHLCGRGRTPLISRARRELVAEAVVVRGLRPLDVSRFLGISSAAVAHHLRALEIGNSCTS